MTKILVNWPRWDDERYRDSGEGGLFSYVVWDSEEANCSIDVFPSMGMGDVLSSVKGPLAESFRLQESDYASFSNSNDGTTSWEEIHYNTQVPLGTVLFLGSTRGAFFEDSIGEYFAVDESTLTPEGSALVRSISEAMGSEPTFLTYLDT